MEESHSAIIEPEVFDRVLRELNERMNDEADAVQNLIAQNARVAQNQDEYNARYDALVSRYEATKVREKPDF